MKDRTVKELFLLAITALFVAGLGPVGFVRLLEGNWMLAGVDLFLAGLCLGLFIQVYATRNTRFPGVAMAWVFAVGALLSSYYQGATQIYWSFPAITAAFFLLESRHALLLCLVFLVANLAMMWTVQPAVMLVSVGLALFAATLVAFSFSLNVQHQHDRLQLIASIDPLTGVGNRRSQDEKLEMVTAMYRRVRFDCCLLLLDVDHFKAINDTHGHAVGDEVLTELAALIRGNTRATETLYRYGGEEFVIVAEHNSLEEAAHLAERLRDIVEQSWFTMGIRLTISIGVAALQAREDSHAWLKRADDALFQAKHSGRNRVVVAEASVGLRAVGVPIEDARPTT